MAYAQTIWNSELVAEVLEKLRYGASVDMSCFHERDPELKASNVLFQLTQEEEDEFIKCSSDIVHFVETYCKFLTDKGRATVDLRDFQEDILSTLGEEEWIEDIEDLGPKVRDFILMASRQTGKCQLFNSQITIKNKLDNSIRKIYIYELLNEINEKLSNNIWKKMIYKLKGKLFKLYIKLS